MSGPARDAWRLRVSGVVQGVGFRPFVFRLAESHRLTGWVLNGEAGVEIHVEGAPEALDAFARELRASAPMPAAITDVAVSTAPLGMFGDFAIRDSADLQRPTARIAPDLPICDACVTELFGADERRRHYPYVSCAHCGPRYSIVTALPYDRARTTLAGWPLCPACRREYDDPADRRFHAQSTACTACGPSYALLRDGAAAICGDDAIRAAAQLLAGGRIVAVKGLGGYHLACDAFNASSVGALRRRKYRKEKPFAVMAMDLPTAHRLAELTPEAEALLTSSARPIVLAAARAQLPEVAPDTREIGVMLPYAPIHHLLFAHGAPAVLVMTSGNRSSEPIAYEDADATARLAGLADAVLAGERPIARRVDDSVARVGPLGVQLVRRARGYAPGVAARIPLTRPTLAVGADLKAAVTLVVDGQAVVSQHIGDLVHAPADRSFQQTIRDLSAMYEVPDEELVIVHDLHPQYVSTQHAQALPARERMAVQHHRAHVASVLAERGAFDQRVLGVAFDGTGYGDDGTIWGGEFFAGSVEEGFTRVGHLWPAVLPGGDAAARFPVQSAAGFLIELDVPFDPAAAPFCFPSRYGQARRMIETKLRTFVTTSAGRLFDTVAALLGFTRENAFEGQAAMWLEQLAGRTSAAARAPMPFREGRLDYRPALGAVIAARMAGRAPGEIARAFHADLAAGIAGAVRVLCEQHGVEIVVLSGGVFQNALLAHDLAAELAGEPLALWTNHVVPPNDGGISLGQAALALRPSTGA